MAAKLDIKRELDAVDQKNYDFYDRLTDEEKKSFAPFILMRYISNSQGDRDIQEWFLERTNEFVNKHHWTLSKNHKSLLWKLCAGVGTGVKTYHQYLAVSRKKANKIEQLLMDTYPNAKLDDIKTLAATMTKQDMETFFDNLGFDEKTRKKYIND